MSLILEALNKAEENQGPTTNYSVHQTCLHEKKTYTKRTFILLAIIACLTTAIITLLIYNKFNSTNEYSRSALQETAYSTSTPQPVPQQVAQKYNSEQPYKEQTTSSTINHKNLSTSVPDHIKPPGKAIASEDSNPARYSEPALHRLVESTTRSGQGKLTPKNHKAFNTVSDNKETNSTNATAKPITPDISANMDTINSTPIIKDISAASNLQLKDIKISVHMYSEMPVKRFVYINSTRYGEGAKINNNLFIDEITENGVILNSHNTLYRLPLKQ